MNQPKDAWGILIDATIRATSLIAQSKGVHAEFAASDESKTAIVQTFKENMERVQQEWADAVEAHMPEAWLRKLMNVQANELGLESLKRMGLI